MEIVLTLLAAVAFAAVHVLAPRLSFIRVVPRSRWLSFAGGVAVAYVFLHLLPELAEHERALSQAEAPELVVYALALTGLAAFYGLERLVRSGRDVCGESGPGVFWLHIASFGLYNLVIGYLLLHREESGAASLAFYVLALGLHFVTNDFGLWQDHARAYTARARWLLAAAVLAGWCLGVAVDLPEEAIIALFSFLAGGVVLNVLKEELPEERKSRFVPFLGGAAGYGALLVAL